MGSSKIMLNGMMVIIASVFTLANLHGIEELWGINLPGFLPRGWSIVFLIIIVALMLPGVGRRAASVIDRLSVHLSENTRSWRLFTFIVAGIFFILFMTLQSAIPLLGDGSLRANEIFDGRMWQPTEMLDYLVHALLYQHVFDPLGFRVTTCYRLVSVISGFFFVLGILRLARYTVPKQFITLFLMLISSGITILFFGYVESYSIVASLLPYVLLSGLKVVDQRGSWLSFLGWYIVAGLFHSIAAILFAPLLLLVLIPSSEKSRRLINRAVKYLPFLVLAGLIVIYVGHFYGIGFLDRNFLSLISDKQHPQSLLSVNHIANLFNWLILSALPFLLLLPMVFVDRLNGDTSPHPRRFFAIGIIVPSLAFMLLFEPQLGGPRDWDLFSLPTFLLIPSITVLFLAVRKIPLPYQLLPVIVISFSNTFAFAYVNSSIGKSVDRFVEIIEVSKFRNLYIEYATLFNHSRNHEELRRRHLEFALEAWEQPPRTRADSLYMSSEIAQLMIAVGDKKQAQRFIAAAMSADSTDLNNYLLLREYLEKFEGELSLVRLAERIEHKFPESAKGQMEAGVMYLKLGHNNRGGQCLERAYKYDSTNSLILLNYGNYLLLSKDIERALVVFRRAVEINPSSFDANFGIASAYSFNGQKALAIDHLTIAERLVRTARDREKVKYLKGQIGTAR